MALQVKCIHFALNISRTLYKFQHVSSKVVSLQLSEQRIGKIIRGIRDEVKESSNSDTVSDLEKHIYPSADRKLLRTVRIFKRKLDDPSTPSRAMMCSIKPKVKASKIENVEQYRVEKHLSVTLSVDESIP